MNGKFSFDTIDDFEDHINKSIPAYDILQNIIVSLSTFCIKQDTNVYDLGCSNGQLLYKISKNNLKTANYIGYDLSKNMIDKCNKYKSDNFNCEIKDVSNLGHYPNASLILSVFTLQFIERHKRRKIIKNIYESLNKKGIFIFVEKEYIGDSYLHELFTFSYYDFKIKKFTIEEIIKKQQDLRSIMLPNRSDENLEYLKGHDWTVNTFFQILNFKGYICIK